MKRIRWSGETWNEWKANWCLRHWLHIRTHTALLMVKGLPSSDFFSYWKEDLGELQCILEALGH